MHRLRPQDDGQAPDVTAGDRVYCAAVPAKVAWPKEIVLRCKGNTWRGLSRNELQDTRPNLFFQVRRDSRLLHMRPTPFGDPPFMEEPGRGAAVTPKDPPEDPRAGRGSLARGTPGERPQSRETAWIVGGSVLLAGILLAILVAARGSRRPALALGVGALLVAGGVMFMLLPREAHRQGERQPEAAPQAIVDRKIRALPYLAGYEKPPARKGVVRHLKEEASQGYNLVLSAHGVTASLMDMDGQTLHHWILHLDRICEGILEGSGGRKWTTPPPYFCKLWREGNEAQCRYNCLHNIISAHLFKNGDLLALVHGFGLLRIDRDSRLIWAYGGESHHEFHVDPRSGAIHVLAQTRNETSQYIEQFVAALDARGRELSRVSLRLALERSDHAGLLRSVPNVGDFLHPNHVEVLDRRLEKAAPLFKEGRVLVSLLGLDAVGLVDMEARRFVWAARGVWNNQHQPTALNSGRLMIFDNGGLMDGSRVLELDLPSMEAAWSYGGVDKEPLRSERRGFAQRLPNSNTLITESVKGRALEVTPQKAVVWEFYNPHRAGEKSDKIATLHKVLRYPKTLPLSWARVKQ